MPMFDTRGEISFAEKQRQVAAHLREHGSITPRIAVERYAAYRLSSIIQRLRKAGWEIETERVQPTGYAHYHLISVPEQKDTAPGTANTGDGEKEKNHASIMSEKGAVVNG